MKALVYTGPNRAELREEPEPNPGVGEVVVQVEAVGICGSDMHAYHGYDERRPPPLVLGHEAAGAVLGGAMAGRRVAVNPLVTCESCEAGAACEACSTGRQHLCAKRHILSMPPRGGAFAERLAIPERNLVPIPDDLSSAHAALAEPIAVSYHAVNQGARFLARPLSACRCVVLGGGAIGLAAALVLRMQGAGAILVGEPSAARRETAGRSGLDCYAPGSEDEPAPNSVDLIIDAVGATATRAASCRMAKPGAAIVHVGLLPGHDGLDIRKITLQEIVVSGTYCYTPSDFREVVAALAARRFGPLDWLEERPLAEGAAALAELDAGTIAAAKIILRP